MKDKIKTKLFILFNHKEKEGKDQDKSLFVFSS